MYGAGVGRRLTALAAFAAAALLPSLWRLDGVLAATHPPGEPGRGMVGMPFAAKETLAAWQNAADVAGFSDPRWIAIVFLVLDCVFVLAYVPLLFAVVEWLREQVEAGTKQHDVLEWAAWPVLALGAFNLAENALALLFVAAPKLTAAVLPLLAFSALKWAAAAAVAAALVVGLAGLRGREEGSRRRPARVAMAWPFAVAGLFTVVLLGPLGGPQLSDVLLRWSGEWVDAVFGVLATLWLSAVLLAAGRRVLERARHGPPLDRIPGRFLLPAGAFLTLVGVGAHVTIGRGAGIGALGLIALALAALSHLVGTVPVPIEITRPELPGGQALRRVVAALPVIALGIALSRAALVELVYAGNGQVVPLLAGGIALQASGWALAWFPEVGRASPVARWIDSTAGLAVNGVLALLFAAMLLVDPLGTSAEAGTIGILAVFCGTAMLSLLVLGRLQAVWSPPSALGIVRFRRLPILLLLLAWGVVASAVDPGPYHDVRVVGGQPAQARVTVEDAWASWLRASGAGGAAGEGERRALPLVLVAASGGGIRAAYWTAEALTCVLDGPAGPCRGGGRRPVPAFVLSGVSGGSVGIAFHTAERIAPQDDGWVRRRLGDDFLAPTVAWMLFADLPNALLRLHPDDDRAGMLERAWERAWLDGDVPARSPLETGLRELRRADPAAPLLLLSGTHVHDGCRFHTSVLEGDVEDPRARAEDCLSLRPFETGFAGAWTFAATQEIADVICRDHDVRLSTAALLSARFPLVSPSGRVEHCRGGDAELVVDGGYFDNSAASSVVELWSRLAPLVDRHNADAASTCVVPVFLQIDNAHAEPRSGRRRRLGETVVPLRAFGAQRRANEASARQAAANIFGTEAFGAVAGATAGDEAVRRYVHLYPRQHPGTKAPLGWALSDASMKDLRDQLTREPVATDVRQAARWFDARLACR